MFTQIYFQREPPFFSSPIAVLINAFFPKHRYYPHSPPLLPTLSSLFHSATFFTPLLTLILFISPLLFHIYQGYMDMVKG